MPRGGETLFPVYARLKTPRVECVKGTPEGMGIILREGALGAKPILNTIASKHLRDIYQKLREVLRAPGVVGRGLGTGHTMEPYTRIGASEKDQRRGERNQQRRERS